MSPLAKLERARRSHPGGVGPSVCVVAVTLGLVAAVSTASAATESVLHSFRNNGADGMEPFAALIAVKDILYGTTRFGGTGSCTRFPPYGCGTVFALNPAKNTETIVYSFQNTNSDGNGPIASLIKSDGVLYGTTGWGGVGGGGTVFSVDRKTGAETVLHSFLGSDYNDGGGPEASLLDVSGTLYGTTVSGGSADEGTLYSVNSATGKEVILHSFCSQCGGDDGSSPESVLINLNGILYGTTIEGGAHADGTVFSFDPSNGSESVVYSFCRKENCPDGNAPNGYMILVKNIFYGTTDAGGTYNHGTIFSLDLASGKEKVLYSFQGGQDGAKPIGSAGLLKIGDILYGTTGEGGGNGCSGYGCGTVFSFDRKTSEETILHAFQDDGADGNSPVAGLVDVNGTLYGTTVYGGKYGYGTVYAVVP